MVNQSLDEAFTMIKKKQNYRTLGCILTSEQKIVIVIGKYSLAQRLFKNTLLQLIFNAIFWLVDEYLHFFDQNLLCILRKNSYRKNTIKRTQ